MRIAVVGANGRTGRLVVEQALARGHGVTALARQPQQSSRRDQRLTTVEVDVLDRGRVVDALSEVDAVISTLGIGTSREATVTYSQGTGNLLHAMGLHGTKRIVVVSASPVGPRQDQAAFDRYVVMPILERFFGATYQDMRRMEALLAESGTDWTSLRPPRLLEKPPVAVPDQPRAAAAEGPHPDVRRPGHLADRRVGPGRPETPGGVRRQLTCPAGAPAAYRVVPPHGARPAATPWTGRRVCCSTAGARVTQSRRTTFGTRPDRRYKKFAERWRHIPLGVLLGSPVQQFEQHRQQFDFLTAELQNGNIPVIDRNIIDRLA